MVDKKRNDTTERNEELLLNDANSNFLSKFQSFVDQNIRVIRHVSWIVGGIGVFIILRRTYALHHFTQQSSIPEIYFTNNVTLTGKVVKIHSDGNLDVQHLPLLWKARVNYITNPDSSLLNINVTGVKLQSGGLNFLSSQLKNKNIKFQLLGIDECENIESIIYQRGWLRYCVNEEIIINGFATVKHVPSLSHVKLYNQLIEKMVKAEVKAVKKKSGIWSKNANDVGIFIRTWTWLKNRIFRRQ